MATASGLLLVYGAGAAIGPVLVGLTMELDGPRAFWSYLMLMLLGLALFTLVRMRLREPPPAESHERFVMLARTSQSALEMLTPEKPADEPPQ